MTTKLTDLQFRVAVAVGAAVLVLLLGYVRFCGSISLPGKPAKPKREVLSFKQVSKRIDAKQVAWEQQSDDSAKRFSVPKPSLAEMTRAFPYKQDTKKRRLIPGKPGASFEAGGLRVTALVINVSRRAHLALKLENLGTEDLAYKIPTRPMRGQRACRSRTAIPHNAMVVPAGKTVVHTECRHKNRFGVIVMGVETMALPPLAARYLSMASPATMGLGARETANHKPFLDSEVCPTIVGGGLAADINAGRVSWRDLADFYARHHCKTYQFPNGYTAFRVDQERPLPAAAAN